MLRIAPIRTDEAPIVVRVVMLNDAGDRAACIVSHYTTADAVAAAEDKARLTTGDDSWTMNEWLGC